MGYTVWYSTRNFADYIIDHTLLGDPSFTPPPNFQKLYESDANNASQFHTVPDHIKKILYLDAPDIIIEYNDEPILSIEISAEAGTGHNTFQRFPRIAAAVENKVPAIYIYPAGKLIERDKTGWKWDQINPLIFYALYELMDNYDIPALLYYFPTDSVLTPSAAIPNSPHFNTKGLIYDPLYPACPDASAKSMKDMFKAINNILSTISAKGYVDDKVRKTFMRCPWVKRQRQFMQDEWVTKKQANIYDMSPLSSVTLVPTDYLINYLSQRYKTKTYDIGKLLRSRPETCIYQADASFRSDPYPGCLAAIDYMECRNGATYEDRNYNLVMVWGNVTQDHANKTLHISTTNNSTISDFSNAVKTSETRNLLRKDYSSLKKHQIPRYYMQVRYGSTYSKSKPIRIYSYFADAILFPDGALWRDA